MGKPEAERKRWALGLTVVFSALIFFSFTFYKGYLSFGNENNLVGQNSKNQVANVISADLAPSPIQNTKETFTAAFKEIDKQFQEFKGSIESVLVPFVTGIEVYERK